MKKELKKPEKHIDSHEVESCVNAYAFEECNINGTFGSCGLE